MASMRVGAQFKQEMNHESTKEESTKKDGRQSIGHEFDDLSGTGSQD